MSSAAAGIGICLRDLPGRDLAGHDPADLPAILRAARVLGFTAVQFPVSHFGVRLGQDAELSGLKRVTDAEGVEIWLDLGLVNATRPERAVELAATGRSDTASALALVVDAAAYLGVRGMTMYIGTEQDRIDPTCRWSEQLDRTAGLLAALGPQLRSYGTQLLVKTHEEISTFEVVRLVETIGSDVLGIAFDPVNVIVRMENPADAARRVRPFVGSIHLDDAIWCPTTAGFERRLRPIGQGSLDWPAILAVLAHSGSRSSEPRLLFDIHRAELTAPYLEADWATAYPDVTPEEAAQLTSLAAPAATTVTDPSARVRLGLTGMQDLGLLPRRTTAIPGPDPAAS